MGIIICFPSIKQNITYNTKGDKMCKKLIGEIRNKEKMVEDMPFRAREVLNYFEISDFSEGVPIVEILTKLGFKVYQSDLEPKGLSAYIAVDPKFVEAFGSNKITCVHISDNIGHKRFALAHELAHYLFDFDEKNKLHYYNTYFPQKEDNNNQEEKRANAFAANLLMPKEEFIEKFKEIRKFQELQNLYSKADMVSSLSQYFLVSPTAVALRFDELKECKELKGYN